jgi:hypothetical protein
MYLIEADSRAAIDLSEKKALLLTRQMREKSSWSFKPTKLYALKEIRNLTS